MKIYDYLIIGTGMGSLSVASLLSQKNKKTVLIEQNYLPGGCTSSYWRKGFVFEAGATTLVGLDHGQPLDYLFKKLKININVRTLDTPMQVVLSNGNTCTRYQNIDQWITEAERVFGKKNQASFWKHCYEISKSVWQVSTKQGQFPPTSLNDFISMVKNFEWKQLKMLPYGVQTMDSFLAKYGLLDNKLFVDFVNEQLLITAQNHINEVNVLFGATALCYTNYTNYYVDGGLINLVNPILSYIQQNNGEVRYREKVLKIKRENSYYHITTDKEEYLSEYLICGLPINNVLEICDIDIKKRIRDACLGSEKLNSAFQMGIGFKSETDFECIHYQIHLPKPLPYIGSKSIFVSLNHPSDKTRCDDPSTKVASVSTHWNHPAREIDFNKPQVEQFIIEILEQNHILKRENVVYKHSSTPTSWAKWTGRKYGFVGGYPQYKIIKPWQMPDARLDGYKAYLVGDSVYPGQGIPGVTLSGIIAYNKLSADWNI
jgi:phytoene dehydrogenase-like protein